MKMIEVFDVTRLLEAVDSQDFSLMIDGLKYV